MKAVIFAGGLGSRLSEETVLKPKPMVEIGGKPIIWHIMKIYSFYGIDEFVILCGYKGHIIKEYFANYFVRNSDITISLKDNQVEVQNASNVENWKITLVDTGELTMTGSRLKKARQYIGDDPFLLTYGDGVGDINITKLIKSHRLNSGLVTMTIAQPDGRFGSVELLDNQVTSFVEKPKGDGSWINAGFFVCEPAIFDYLGEGEDVVFEQDPLCELAQSNNLFSHKHEGFWMPMDTIRDRNILNQLWDDKKAIWKIWK